MEKSKKHESCSHFSDMASSLLEWPHSLIAVDPGSTLYNHTASRRMEFSRILVISLCTNETLYFNLLDEISKDSAFRDAAFVAGQFVDDTGAHDMYLCNAAKELLTAVFLHIKCSDYNDKSLFGALSMLSGTENEDEKNMDKSLLNSMISSTHCNVEIHKIITRIARRNIKRNTEERLAVISITCAALRMFENPFVSKISSESDFCVRDFQEMDMPLTLYITVPMADSPEIASYALIISRFMEYKLLQAEETQDAYTFPRPVLIINDILPPQNYTRTVCITQNNGKPFKSRDELLQQCAGSLKPNVETKQWYHIPEEMYMTSDEIYYKPIFSSSINEKNDNTEPVNSVIQKQNSIPKKKMFFNDREQEQLTGIENALHGEKYADLTRRMRKKGLKKQVVCLFYGGPGTGKTEAVLQIARKTGRNLMKADIALLRKERVGESENAIKDMFNAYDRLYRQGGREPILFMNEMDGIFQRRIDLNNVRVNTYLSMDANTMQNLLLDFLENFEGIMIGTSNFAENMDKAFERRILFKIKFDLPNRNVQKKIWKSEMPELGDDDIDRITARYNFTGGNIINIVRKNLIHSLLTGNVKDMEKILGMCEEEKFNHAADKVIKGFA
jgi:AAA+ superfamily predicted ATPase